MTIGQDPQLLPLANYGGPTETRKLLATSPALDMWLMCGPVTFGIRTNSPSGGAFDDQRGVLRPQGPACDIGAFECQPMECAGGVAPTPTPTVPAPTPTFTPTTPVTGVPPTVPTLSFPMLALLAIALAGAAMFLMGSTLNR